MNGQRLGEQRPRALVHAPRSKRPRAARLPSPGGAGQRSRGSLAACSSPQHPLPGSSRPPHWLHHPGGGASPLPPSWPGPLALRPTLTRLGPTGPLHPRPGGGKLQLRPCPGAAPVPSWADRAQLPVGTPLVLCSLPRRRRPGPVAPQTTARTRGDPTAAAVPSPNRAGAQPAPTLAGTPGTLLSAQRASGTLTIALSTTLRSLKISAPPSQTTSPRGPSALLPRATPEPRPAPRLPRELSHPQPPGQATLARAPLTRSTFTSAGPAVASVLRPLRRQPAPLAVPSNPDPPNVGQALGGPARPESPVALGASWRLLLPSGPVDASLAW